MDGSCTVVVPVPSGFGVRQVGGESTHKVGAVGVFSQDQAAVEQSVHRLALLQEHFDSCRNIMVVSLVAWTAQQDGTIN